MHVFLWRLNLSDFDLVAFYSFFYALGQLFFVNLDLRHANVDGLAQLIEALHLDVELLRLLGQLHLHAVHLRVDCFARIDYLVALEAKLRLQAVDLLETLLDGEIGL